MGPLTLELGLKESSKAKGSSCSPTEITMRVSGSQVKCTETAYFLNPLDNEDRAYGNMESFCRGQIDIR